MATPKIIADFETQLATAVAVGATSFTLASATDDDGVSLPTGKYYLTIDNGSTQKEYIVCTVTGTAATAVSSVSRQGTETSGFARAHRVGASVIMTDFMTYKNYIDETTLVSAPDASTTTKGVVEIATLAQVRAGTGTGETGAILVVSPTELDDLPTADEKAAMAGSSPSSTNPFLTRGKIVTAGASISGATLPVPVYQNKSDNEFYACDANDTSAMKFLGFAISDGINGGSMTVQFSGIVSGFTGLAEGEKYYLQDAVGTIGTTIGTYEVLVGVAISETELLIQKGRRRSSGVLTFTDGGADESTQTSVVTLGFRPSVIRASSTVIPSLQSTAFSTGIWNNGAYSAIYFNGDGGGSTNAGTIGSVILYQLTASGRLDWQITITSVTDTGFTFSALQKDASPTPIYIVWEAEGEL